MTLQDAESHLLLAAAALKAAEAELHEAQRRWTHEDIRDEVALQKAQAAHQAAHDVFMARHAEWHAMRR